jgi:hypothetical protein
MADGNDNTYGEEDIDANEYEFCRFEWNLIAVEKESKNRGDRHDLSALTRLVASPRTLEKA